MDAAHFQVIETAASTGRDLEMFSNITLKWLFHNSICIIFPAVHKIKSKIKLLTWAPTGWLLCLMYLYMLYLKKIAYFSVQLNIICHIVDLQSIVLFFFNNITFLPSKKKSTLKLFNADAGRFILEWFQGLCSLSHCTTDDDNRPLYKSEGIQSAPVVHYKHLSMSWVTFHCLFLCLLFLECINTGVSSD